MANGKRKSAEETKQQKKSNETALEKFYDEKVKKRNTPKKRLKSPFYEKWYEEQKEGEIKGVNTASSRRAYRRGDLKKEMDKVRKNRAKMRQYYKRYNKLNAEKMKEKRKATKITGMLVRVEKIYLQRKVGTEELNRIVFKAKKRVYEQIVTELINISQFPQITPGAEILYTGATKSASFRLLVEASAEIMKRAQDPEALKELSIRELTNIQKSTLEIIKKCDNQVKELSPRRKGKQSEIFQPIFDADCIVSDE